MSTVTLIFPHQLFEDSKYIDDESPKYLIEEFLYFKHYKFHKQKIAYHRASMKHYEQFLKIKGQTVRYVEAINETSNIRQLIPQLAKDGITRIQCYNPEDNWLEKRLKQTCREYNIEVIFTESPMHLNTRDQLSSYFKSDKKKYHQTTFYKQQREKRDILLDQKGEPLGGKWTYDTENRKKYPAKKTPPSIQFPDTDAIYNDAVNYVNTHFKDHLGTLTTYQLYPTTFKTAKSWLQDFLKQRFAEFGPYEDAIVKEESILNHSVLTPMLNVGLLTPQYVLDEALAYSREHNIPINSTEGFVRQIIGWREFIRAIYIYHGTMERTKNFWEFNRKIPQSFYDGTTGIVPIDVTIKKVLQTGYCHHIERLMILGNFMLLCEFDPKEVYRWFMELFIDAYDWVMVPNIYGMSQFSDGGLFATKPYISGSNYVMKMSNYKKGEWQDTWDGLFWNFMDKHREFFLGNPRLGMLVRMFDKMTAEKKENHIINAKRFLDSLDN